MTKKRFQVDPQSNGCRRYTQRLSGTCRRQRRRKYDSEATAIIVREYSQVVKFIAHKLAYNLPPSVEVDDLISVGMIGLMDAAERFEEKRGLKFQTFAEFRIRGAMLDELRRIDILPRGVRDKAKKIEAERDRIRNRTGRPATDSEVGVNLGMAKDEVIEMRGHQENTKIVHFEDMGLSSAPADENTATVRLDFSPYEFASRDNIRRIMEQVMDDLPEREQHILALYYFQDLSLKEIGAKLKVTESRVSQLHTRALTALRELLDRQEYSELRELLA